MPGDARTANWRFVVPDEPPGMLVLPPDGELRPLLRRGPYPAVAAPDLRARSTGGARATARLIDDLCGAVAPGGWLCLGFANALYPAAPGPGALRLATVRRRLRRCGLDHAQVYVCLPEHRSPALLVPVRRPAETDFVLDRLFLTYSPPGARLPRLRRRLLGAMRAAAVRTPHRLRTSLAPGYCLVARRPA